MKIINQNIFDGSWNGMVHCANLYHTFGAGIAKQIKIRYPTAYQADCETSKGSEKKLGTYSSSYENDKTIYNLYGQVGIGNNGDPLKRNCKYDHIHDAMWLVCEHIIDTKGDSPYTLGIPYGMGCGLAGGDFKIVYVILESIESQFPDIQFTIYKL